MRERQRQTATKRRYYIRVIENTSHFRSRPVWGLGWPRPRLRALIIMSSTWASVVPAGTVPKDYPRLLDGLSARPVASVSRRSPRSRANRGPRAGFLGVGRASWSTRASTSRSAPDTATRAGLNSRQGRPSRDPPSCGRTDWKTLVFGVLPLALRARPVRRAVRDEGRVLSPAVVAVSVSPCSTVATEDSAPVSSARTFTQADWPTLNGVTVIHGFEWHRGTFSFDELTTGTRRAGVGAIVGAQSRTGREHLQGSSPPDSTDRYLTDT